MTKIDARLRTILRVTLWKQWEVPIRRYHWLRKLGISHDIAWQTSYMRDHYQFMVTKTNGLRVISKKKLANMG